MVNMAEYCWFKVAGFAEVLYIPEDEQDLQFFLSSLESDIPVFVLGAGSNLLLRGGGIAGVVIGLFSEAFNQTSFDGKNFTVGASVRDMNLARTAKQFERTGLEFYAGIPGSIGGAVVMNAGARGTETADRLISCRIMERNGCVSLYKREDLNFSYRYSCLPKESIVIDAVFSSRPGDSAEIAKNMKEILRHRAEAQPQGVRTGGSTFKNPSGHKAWELIDAAGCRDFHFGGAKMSKKHCNFMINDTAQSPDCLEVLGEMVRMRVHEHSQIMLEWEIRRVGARE
jgi:UDP-N-acetylmuramate dehydrogenase